MDDLFPLHFEVFDIGLESTDLFLKILNGSNALFIHLENGVFVFVNDFFVLIFLLGLKFFIPMNQRQMLLELF